MVHGLFIGDTGHVEMDILHDHADAFFFLTLFPVLVAGTDFCMTLRVDMQFYVAGIGIYLFRCRYCRFHCSLRFLLHGCSFRRNLFRILFAELDFVDFVSVEDDCLEGEIEQPA